MLDNIVSHHPSVTLLNHMDVAKSKYFVTRAVLAKGFKTVAELPRVSVRTACTNCSLPECDLDVSHEAGD